jgi:hypothetical protein
MNLSQSPGAIEAARRDSHNRRSLPNPLLSFQICNALHNRTRPVFHAGGVPRGELIFA